MNIAGNFPRRHQREQAGRMTIVIGTDEAGYGPNLGPLVVAATAWRIEAAPAAAEEAVAGIASRVANTVAAAGPLWGDSKQIYRSGSGFAALERGVLVGLLLAERSLPASWPALATVLGGITPPAALLQGEWQRLAGLPLPREADTKSCHGLAAAATAALADGQASLVAMAGRAIYPGEFNALLDRGLNKSDILSQATLDLAAALRAEFADVPAVIWCDRHGGRKSYSALVARHFTAPLLQAIEETPSCSAYLIPSSRPATPATQIEFRVGGESRLPVALASMTAKYVRELAMQAFNGFWSERAPGLMATAGYPVDARRWRAAAAAAIRAAGVADDALWRRV